MSIYDQAPRKKSEWPSAIAIIAIFATIGLLIYLFFPDEPPPFYPNSQARCTIGTLARIDNVAVSEHSVEASHFRITYIKNGEKQSHCSFFSQVSFDRLQKMATAKEQVCILHDANKNNAVGIFRPRYLSIPRK